MRAKQVLHDIQVLDFALQDVSLYLDLHPTDVEALKFYKTIKKQLTLSKKEYEQNYHPLTNRSVFSNDVERYVKDIWPWERGGC